VQSEKLTVSASSLPIALLVNSMHMIYDVAAMKLRLNDLEFEVFIVVESGRI
jgi:hypothetical protein